MELTLTTIISAIITGILGPIIILITRHIIEQRKYPTPSNERLKKLLKTNWHGFWEQIDPNDNSKKLITDIDFQLSNKGRIIIGEANFISTRNLPEVFTIKNGIFDGNILKMEYENKDLGIFQKGSAIIEMNTFGNELKGNFVGYSPNLKQIISGDIIMKK